MSENGWARSLDGKTALITGGASGVGFECAKLFATDGANIFIVGRNEDKLRGACKALKSAGVRFANFLAGDVAQPEFAERTFDAAGDVHFLINNAGAILRKPAAETSDAEWRDLMAINLDGVFYFSRAAAKRMKGEGAIINVSSTCGQVGAAGLAAYCASKGGVDQLTRTMALELAPRKITVNAVAPGAINSPMLFDKRSGAVTREEVIENNLEAIPIGAVAAPQEVARAIRFLAGERHITGAVLSVDGGYTAR